MIVETATTESFRSIIQRMSLDALPDSDFTAKALLEELPAGQEIFYRIAFENLSAPPIIGEPQIGRFRTAPGDRRSVSFGLQFFGHVAIDGATGVMTVTLKDVADRALWSIDLTPQPRTRVAGTGAAGRPGR